VMFEVTFPTEKVAYEALLRAAHKLPMKCRIIKRHGRVMVICDNPKHKQRQG